MLTSFFSKRSRIIASKCYFSTVTAKGIPTMGKEKLSEGQAALNHVNDLYKKGQYEEALKEIARIEERYPGCSKATKYYRGEVAYALLEKTGDLRKLTP